MGVTVHHSASPTIIGDNIPEVLRNTQSYHVRNRGWSDIGYNYAVDPLGDLWELRGLTRTGAHSKSFNGTHLGVVLLGNFEIQIPTRQALRTLDQFIAWLGAVHGEPIPVVGHRDQGSTACPGENLYDLIHG